MLSRVKAVSLIPTHHAVASRLLASTHFTPTDFWQEQTQRRGARCGVYVGRRRDLSVNCKSSLENLSTVLILSVIRKVCRWIPPNKMVSVRPLTVSVTYTPHFYSSIVVMRAHASCGILCYSMVWCKYLLCSGNVYVCGDYFTHGLFCSYQLLQFLKRNEMVQVLSISGNPYALFECQFV